MIAIADPAQRDELHPRRLYLDWNCRSRSLAAFTAGLVANHSFSISLTFAKAAMAKPLASASSGAPRDLDFRNVARRPCAESAAARARM
jgi:hypothetical protein